MSDAVQRRIYGQNGPLTIADLPLPGTKRWVIRRKAEVVAAVRGGILSLELACHRYMLSLEEYLSWQDSIDSYGFAALRVTRLNDYRFSVPRPSVGPANESARPGPQPTSMSERHVTNHE